jgi:hypothetical protein
MHSPIRLRRISDSRESAHSFVDLDTIPPVLWRKRHYRVVRLGRDHHGDEVLRVFLTGGACVAVAVCPIAS